MTVSDLVDKTITQSTGRTSEPELERPASRVLTLLLECDRPTAGSAMIVLDGLARVTVVRGDARTVREVRGPRGERSVVVELPDKRVSSRHAEIEVGATGARLRDLGSANGTKLGGERVTDGKLAHGDLVQVGHCLFAYEEKVLRADVPMTIGARTRLTTFSPDYALKLAQLARIAMTPIPVLLLGESGTGKEVLARVTHELSGRPGQFVAVNCGAIPQNLVESHLFGHVKGSFSGAVRDEVGFVRAADGGTLFLDEIGDLPASSQAALLRVLQEGEVHPVGAARPMRVDVRVVAATHQSLERMQADGTFRRDLYARLSGFVLEVPSLRARREDLGQLIGELLARGAAPTTIRPEAVLQLLRHAWPLNVRELAQALTTASALAEGVIKVDHLPQTVAALVSELSLHPDAAGESPSHASERPLGPEDQALKDELVQRLERNGGNISAVAREMDKARQQIQRWVKRFGLKGA